MFDTIQLVEDKLFYLVVVEEMHLVWISVVKRVALLVEVKLYLQGVTMLSTIVLVFGILALNLCDL